METYAPIIATVVSGLVFAGLKWVGKRSAAPWHKWAIPGITAVLALLRLAGAALGIALPEFPIDAALGTATALSLHQAVKGATEKVGE